MGKIHAKFQNSIFILVGAKNRGMDQGRYFWYYAAEATTVTRVDRFSKVWAFFESTLKGPSDETIKLGGPEMPQTARPSSPTEKPQNTCTISWRRSKTS